MPLKTVSEVARLAGVSVRTLHHYDEIGLVQPTDRSEAGYRLYDEAALMRLHDVLTWRGLGFPLDEVRALIDDPDHDMLEALFLHRERLVDKVGALNERIAALDSAIAKARTADPLTHKDLVALFDGFDPAEFADEAQTRWADAPEHQESQRRTQRYREADWRQIKAEQAAVESRLADLMTSGIAPEAPDAVAAAEAHRAHIDRWFYAVSAEVHLGLADMYVEDPRFRAHYDAVAPGLASFLRDAVHALHRPRVRRL